ncbi:MAG: hypothetical protein BWY15_01198 [Firmicutes bacterium ADurb.Bin193]|nr:MAG: hypothetical protein BWY15_01198 [Firmicutes bacterium ADurb.Bin193]
MLNSFEDNANGLWLSSNGTTLQVKLYPRGILDISEADSTVTKVSKWKAWLALNPVTVIYPLATSLVTNLEYEEITTYYPQTNIYTNATVQPMLDGKFRFMD